MKVILIGSYPPPYGGISIHMQRLYKKLMRNGINTEIYSLNKIKKENERIKYFNLKKDFIKLIFLKKDNIIHFHGSSFKARILLAITAYIFRRKVIMTVHGVSLEEEYKRLNIIGKVLYKFFLNKISYLIVVNPQIKEWCIQNNILKEKIEVIPGYIDPIVDEEDYEKIDKQVWNFIEKRKKAKDVVITANGNIRFYNNEDLYGIDLLVELVERLREKNYKLSLIFALLGYEQQSKEERIYFEKLLKKIKDNKLESFIYFYKVKDTEYYPILEKADIFIRSTNTDGDAISLREGIYFKKICIASDVVVRPDEIILIKNRNIKELLLQVENVIKNYKIEKKRVSDIEIKEYFNEILEVYKKIGEN